MTITDIVEKLLGVNRTIATIILIVLALISIATSILGANIDRDFLIWVAVFVFSVGFIALLVAKAIDNERLMNALVWIAFLMFVFYILSILFSIMVYRRDVPSYVPAIYKNPYCVMKFWVPCDAGDDAALRASCDDAGRKQLPTPPVKTTSNARVFIQFAGAIDRQEIRDLNAKLRGAGWNVQSDSGERTAAAIGFNEVRYRSPGDEKAAEALAQFMNEIKLSKAKTVAKLTGSLVAENSIEIWISR